MPVNTVNWPEFMKIPDDCRKAPALDHRFGRVPDLIAMKPSIARLPGKRAGQNCIDGADFIIAPGPFTSQPNPKL